MKKPILLLFILGLNHYSAFAQSSQQQAVMEAVLPRIEYALACNSTWGSISDVVPASMTVENNEMIVDGFYKQSLFIKGGEFNRLSGAFRAVFDQHAELISLSYKVSFKRGVIKHECL